MTNSETGTDEIIGAVTKTLKSYVSDEEMSWYFASVVAEEIVNQVKVFCKNENSSSAVS